jgi:hypothetical protein
MAPKSSNVYESIFLRNNPCIFEKKKKTKGRKNEKDERGIKR